MKFLRLGLAGQERDAVMIDDVHAVYVPEMPSAQSAERYNLSELARRVENVRMDGANPVDVRGVRIGAPLQPGKIVCVGLNYLDHAAEGGQAAPAEPILFMKAPDTVVGPNDAVQLPPDSVKTDWEVEFGIVIGKEASNLHSAERALDHVFGYVLCNDISERHFQLELGGQWDKGKNCPTFFPMGPYLVSGDELGDPQDISLGLDVNGRIYQESSTRQMIFSAQFLVQYISRFMTLYPGDVISTGTPAGVGAGQKPPVYLKPGDNIRAWASGLGEQNNPVIRARL
jgi:2-keto-4-pentenoate hydratase/2-oxohepta-3-ene-1,7-dioic acid hydratase in catechol pathway